MIEKQILEDFKNAEQQISDYIDKFQIDLDRLLIQRETKEAQTDNIRASLEIQKNRLNELMYQLHSIQKSLNSWKPVYAK